MAKTLTIVARDPDGDITAVLDGNGDGQLQDVLDILANRVQADHVVMRAATVHEVKNAINAYRGSHGNNLPDLIQIMGHGSPGSLSLGEGAWPSRVEPQRMSFHLFSDTGSYGTLKEKVEEPCRVLVLGCSVGAVGAMTSADGATLLFDLSHMWGCEVSAPVDAIDDKDFDATGLYLDDAAHTARLTVAKNDTVTKGSPAAEVAPIPETPPQLTFTRLLSAPSLKPFDNTTLELNGAALAVARQLAALIGPPSSRIPILAGPEFVFEAFDTEQAQFKVEFICNRRYVRVTPAGHTVGRVFTVGVEERADAKRLLWDLAAIAGVPEF